MKSEKIVKQAIIDSLKREFIKASWWEEVHDDVKTRLNWMIEHVEEIGSLFSRSFMSLFRWEFERRRLEGMNVISPMASYFSTLMGMRISEEAYQCGLLATRAMLDLYDFIQPTDSDVTACLMYCHKIEVLEKSGMLEIVEMDLKTSPSEMSKVLRVRKKKKQDKPIQEETIMWDDPETEDSAD